MKLSDTIPHINQVLIKLESNESIKLEDGNVIYMPPESKQLIPEEFKPLRGEVIGVPSKLYFKNGDHTGLKWRTEMELQIGDRVIMKRPALSMALSKDQGSWFEENGEVYIYLRYDEIIIAIRKRIRRTFWTGILPNGATQVNDKDFEKHLKEHNENPENHYEEKIVLNSFVIVSPLQLEYNTHLIVPDVAKKDSMYFGTVKYIGSPNQEYHVTKNSKNEDVVLSDEIIWVRKEDEQLKIDVVELQVGDLIQFPKSSAIPIEPELFRTLGAKDEKLYRMQRFNIICKL